MNDDNEIMTEEIVLSYWVKGEKGYISLCPVCHNPYSGYCYTCGVHIRG